MLTPKVAENTREEHLLRRAAPADKAARRTGETTTGWHLRWDSAAARERVTRRGAQDPQLDGPIGRTRLDLAVADRVATVRTGVLAGARAGGQRVARRMMKREGVWFRCAALTFVVVGRRAPSARRGMCRGWSSQRDRVRASLLFVPERPKTPAG